MKRMLLSCVALSLCISATAFSDEKVEYPKDYREWTHIKTLTLHEGHPLENPFKGIHHIYANKKGLAGIKSGKFKDGSVIVFDLLESVTQDNASAEGKRILVGVMVKNKKRFAQTGGWGFEAWAESSTDKRLTNDGGRSCFECHTSQKDNDYVFSKWRD
ncbi:MAG: cytochrome P460 family protein [Gammaproteobacteria bacterium]|nr:cytochrome P460 family protein [Gammaproteobacteria bacterium]